jgi:hypothetical protein
MILNWLTIILKVYQLIKEWDESADTMPNIEDFKNIYLITMKMSADCFTLGISGIDHNVIDWRQMEGSFSVVNSQCVSSAFKTIQRKTFFGKSVEEDISEILPKIHYELNFKCNS